MARDRNPSATHETLSREEELKGSSDRVFGLVFAGVFLVLAVLPLVRGHSPRRWALAVGVAFLVAALLYPRVLTPLNWLWLRLGLLLHAVMTPFILGMLFYTTVTPIGLLMRWLGKNPLSLRFDKALPTYWIERHPPGPAPESMPRQF